MIEYTDEHVDAKIEVHFETGRDYVFRHKILGAIGTSVPEESPDFNAAWLYHPACVSCSSGVVIVDGASNDVRELTLDQFLSLPGPLFGAWLEKVLTVNAHLLKHGGVTEETDAKKKAK